jgi:hypothetical protein
MCGQVPSAQVKVQSYGHALDPICLVCLFDNAHVIHTAFSHNPYLPLYIYTTVSSARYSSYSLAHLTVMTTHQVATLICHVSEKAGNAKERASDGIPRADSVSASYSQPLLGYFYSVLLLLLLATT